MHSWRVLILPSLGYQHLYNRYDFNEPWNGPNNRLLAAEVPSEYQCATIAGQSKQTTSYLAVVGPNTAWPGTEGRSVFTITGGSDSAILLVELADSSINWMEPKDFTVEDVLENAQAMSRSHIGASRPTGIRCVMDSGSFQILRKDCSREELDAAVDIDRRADDSAWAYCPWPPAMREELWEGDEYYGPWFLPDDPEELEELKNRKREERDAKGGRLRERESLIDFDEQ